MNDRLLVEALRSRDTGAPAAMYDAYADRLYDYCWLRLRSAAAAGVALRDTFIVAESHIDKLRDPVRFGAWLYAIARLECGRRMPHHDSRPDLPIASHDQEDVDERMTAWQAVMSLSTVSRDLLDLRHRHGFEPADLAAICAIAPKEVEDALDQAERALAMALTAELLAKQAPYDCPDRDAIMSERRGELTVEIRRLLAAHARLCGRCRSQSPRTVSAAKVYRLLPRVAPGDSLRQRVLGCFFDPKLVDYRVFVAARIATFTPSGFPVMARSGSADLAGHPFRRLTHAVAAAIAAVAVVGAVIATLTWVDGPGERDVTKRSAPQVIAAPPALIPPPQREPATGPDELIPVEATFPVGARISAAPPSAFRRAGFRRYQSAGEGGADPGPPGGQGALQVSPLYLDLGDGSTGTVSLQAQGGALTWRAARTGPTVVSPSAGRLADGGTATVTVRVFRTAKSQGQAVITFQPGGAQVTVTWRPQTPGGPGGPTGPTDPPTSPPTSPPPTSPPTEPSTEPPAQTPSDPPPPTQPPASDPPPTQPPPSTSSSQAPPVSSPEPSRPSPDPAPASGPEPTPSSGG